MEIRQFNNDLEYNCISHGENAAEQYDGQYSDGCRATLDTWQAHE